MDLGTKSSRFILEIVQFPSILNQILKYLTFAGSSPDKSEFKKLLVVHMNNMQRLQWKDGFEKQKNDLSAWLH